VQRPTRGEVRAEFVGIAARRFAEQGFQATSLEDIAHDAGYSKAAVLYHFGTKDDLLVAVMDWHIEATADLLSTLEQESPGPERTERAIQTLVSFVLDRRPVSPLALSPAHDVATAMTRHPELLDRFREMRQRMGAVLVGPEATLAQHVRLIIAFSGIPAVIIELRDIPAEQLRGPICDVLRDAVNPKEN